MAYKCEHHNDCIEEVFSKAEIICRDRNLAFTPIRQKVLKLVWQHGHSAVKAYDLLEMLQEEDSSAKPITVYRALDFLVENRFIHKLESQNSFIGCNHPTRQHNCTFLICNSCKEVEEFCHNDKLLEEIVSNVDQESFHVEKVTLEMHGTCKNCIQ